MSPVSPPRIGARQKPNERLLHQRRRLHGVILPFAPEVASRKSMQLGTNQRHKPVQGGPVAFPPTSQQFRDVAGPSLHSGTSPVMLRGIIAEKIEKPWCPKAENAASSK